MGVKYGIISLPICDATTLCIGKPSHICETMSMFTFASLVCMF